MVQVGQLTISDGHQLTYRQIKPLGTCHGHIHLLHGMAEHSGRYEGFMQELANQGFWVTAHDHRGHGGSVPALQPLNDYPTDFTFDELVADAAQVIQSFDRNPTIPFILLGHSMGSFIARRYVQLYPVDALILSGTGMDEPIMRTIGTLATKGLAQFLGLHAPNPYIHEVVFGGFKRKVPNRETPYDWLSSNRSLVSNYVQDPYCGGTPTSQFYLTLFQGLKTIEKKSQVQNVPISLPVLFISGEEDPVGKMGAAIWRVANQYKSVGLEDVTVYFARAGRHELVNDDERKEIRKYVIDWMLERFERNQK